MSEHQSIPGTGKAPGDARTPRDPRMSERDIYLFNEGTHYRLYDHLGSHMVTRDGVDGVSFGVWAPNAERVSCVGDFNNWRPGSHALARVGESGIWEGFIPGLEKGTIYKYHVESRFNMYRVNKADPFAVHHETPSATGSRVWNLDYTWNDREWMDTRGSKQRLDSPISIYEVHAGSWRLHTEDGGRLYSYDQLAAMLPTYAQERGFTHVEFLPLTEHPLYRSWGYQTTGYFAPTARMGPPQGLMTLIDALHRHNIGVILDWVPAHFPSDEHGLGYFDGTHLFEHADPRQGFHPDWKSLIFNYGRNEVRAYLISSALFWLDKYHIDGLRLDAVASMLYLNYSREDGEWVANQFGGRENLEAIDFLQTLNKEVYRCYPDVQTFAEESTAWPHVSKPVYDGGLGFGFKWDMGWMHDTLKHLGRDPVHRRYHYNELTFRGMYMHAEHYTLPLSHDEVVHMKGSLLGKMHGDDWQKRANLRLLLTNQWTQPGKKLLFMGCEFAQPSEWNEERQLDWHVLDDPRHAGILALVDRLNHLYKSIPALHELDADPAGFQWVEANDRDRGVLAFLRKGKSADQVVLCCFNTTPVPHHDVLLGVPSDGRWVELLNTDAEIYGGSNVGNRGAVEAFPMHHHDQPFSLRATLPPLGALVLAPESIAGSV